MRSPRTASAPRAWRARRRHEPGLQTANHLLEMQGQGFRTVRVPEPGRDEAVPSDAASISAVEPAELPLRDRREPLAVSASRL